MSERRGPMERVESCAGDCGTLAPHDRLKHCAWCCRYFCDRCWLEMRWHKHGPQVWWVIKDAYRVRGWW